MKTRTFTSPIAKLFVSMIAVVAAMLVAPAPAIAVGEPMQLVFSVNANDTIELPLNGTVNATVDWDDSNVENVNSAGWRSHTFGAAGTYTVSITGTVTQFGACDGYSWSFTKLTDVLSFGDIGLTSLCGAFAVATDLQSLPTNIPSTVTDTSWMFRSAYRMNVPAISSWNMTNVTNTRAMFVDAQAFNQPLADWDVSHVTNMSSMFDHAYNFNQPLADWDVSSVDNMVAMFSSTNFFNQDLNGWDTHNVTNMDSMFVNALAFNGAIDQWDVSSVTNFANMFKSTSAFDQPIVSWDTSAALTMELMFFGTQAFDQPLNGWDVSHVTNFDHMFQQARVFNQDLDQWNTGAALSVQEMFNQTPVFNGNISTWDVSKVENFWGMLANTEAFNSDISNWDVGHANSFGYMFFAAHVFNQDISAWRAPNINSLDCMFAYAPHFNQPIGDWNVSNVNSMYATFAGASDFNQDLSNWDVSHVINFADLFHAATHFNQNLSDWDTSSATNMFAMFADTADFNQLLVQDSAPGGWNTSSVTSFQNMFSNAHAFDQSVTSWDTHSATSVAGMFIGAENFNQPLPTTAGGWDLSHVTDVSYMFAYAYAFNQDLNSWDVSNVTNFYGMFDHAITFNGDISNWNVGSAHLLQAMFRHAIAFNQPLADWDVSQATGFSEMFSDAFAFNQPLNTWDMSSAQALDDMFRSAVNFNQPLDAWDVSSVNTMRGMFYSAETFNQPLNSWDTSNVNNMAGMFAGTHEFNQPLNNWDTSNVYDMNAMFYFALKFDSDIHSWDTGNVGDMSNMFAQSPFNQPIGDWDVSNVSNTTSMFYHDLYFNQPIGDWDTHRFGFVNTMFTFASAFNQPIGDWDLTGAIQMGEMFAGASSFNQDLSNWRIPNVYYINGLFNGAAMSDANYSAFLVSMNNQPHVANLSLISPAKYLCSAADARANLILNSNWWIVDGGAAACRDSQTIDFPQPASMGMNKSRILTATATSGLPVSYQWISGPCSVDANVVSAFAEGVCVVAAQQVGNGAYDDAMQVLRSITITGAEMPEVVYVGNGATGGNAPVDPNGPYIPGDTAVVVGAGDLARPGYQFIGWNTNSDGTGDTYQANDHVQLHMNDVVLFAQWQGLNPHMVNFSSNGANGDAPLGETHFEGSDFMLPAGTGMSLDHYEFVGWSTSPDGLGDMYDAGEYYTVGSGDITLYAIWQRVAHTNFSLIAAGSSWTGGAATDIDNGTTITLPTASEVTKSGYVLTGWSRTENGAVDFAPGATYVVDGNNEALYAVWASTQRTVVKKTMSIKFWPYMALLSLGNMKAIRAFVKKYLKGHTSGLTITVYGYVQHTKNGKKIPAPVAAFNKSLQKARAKAVIAYLKSQGIKVTYKAKTAESNSTSAAARKATIVASWLV